MADTIKTKNNITVISITRFKGCQVGVISEFRYGRLQKTYDLDHQDQYHSLKLV